MRISTIGRLLFIGGLLAAAVAPAHAQFGALRRAAAGAAARAAGNGVAGGAATQPGGPPRFEGETLEITADVARRFTLALGAERQERARVATDRAAMGEAQGRIERFERCQRREQDRVQDENDAVSETQKAQLAVRMTQAMMRGDTLTYRRMMDSLTNAQANRVAQAEGACGARPNDAYQLQRRVQDAETRVIDAGAEAGGFSLRQLAILRERIAPYVLANGQMGGGERAYSQTELDALRGALPGLTGFATELRS